MTNARHSLFSRIVLVLVVGGTLVAAYRVVSLALEPVAVPSIPPIKKDVQFNPKGDVSKNAVFGSLRPVGPEAVVPGTVGKANPFTPPYVPTTTRVIVP